MKSNAEDAWSQLYLSQEDMAYPAEGVIRIFKGRFPQLMLPPPEEGMSILDLGCGDGRHLPFLHNLGFQVSGVEISEEICAVLRDRMARLAVPVELRTGHAGAIPFADGSFDRLLTWNSCYYMSMGSQNFEDHVGEIGRVIKPRGWLIASIPKKTSFIFRESQPTDRPGYRVIRNDYFQVRDGEIMRCMEDRDDLVTSFASEFQNFCHADLDMEWFGLPYHWHVFCAQRRSS